MRTKFPKSKTVLMLCSSAFKLMMHSFSAPADICHFLNKFSLLTFFGNAKQLMVLWCQNP